jgi:alpha-tubulin suppressor-like RCC1 family protein
MRRTRLLFPLLVAVFAGCQDATAPVTVLPDAAQAARLQAFGFVLSSISAGATGACGVSAGGEAYCWGDNTNGTLGNGTNDQSGVPVPVSGDLAFTSVSGNTLTTCGLTKAGQGYCWGDGFFGGLGDGTLGSTTVPVPVSGGITFTALSSSRFGLGFTCGIAKGGNGYCWGIAGEGELGNGSSTPGVDFNVPVPVSGGLTFSSISAGSLHACGLTKGGEVYCWGNNTNGELGLGFTSSFPDVSGSNVPARTSTGLAFVRISAGNGYTCGVAKGGAGYCWGANNAGQLGDGSTTSRNAPVQISGGLSFVSMSAGGMSTCGLTKTGGAHCWGSNLSGELGIGSTGTDPVTSPVPVSGGFTFTSISVGLNFACGVTSRLGAFCWGDNALGQLGSGLSVLLTDAPTPVATP